MPLRRIARFFAATAPRAAARPAAPLQVAPLSTLAAQRVGGAAAGAAGRAARMAATRAKKSPAPPAAAPAAADEGEGGAAGAADGDSRREMPGYYGLLQRAFPSHLIVYQKGGFYELWGEDALAASRAVPLRLARSGLAGFPTERGPAWVQKLLEAGHTVAMVEQVPRLGAYAAQWRDPLAPLLKTLLVETTKRTRASEINRALVRIFTPATLPLDMRAADDTSSIVLAVMPRSREPAIEALTGDPAQPRTGQRRQPHGLQQQQQRKQQQDSKESDEEFALCWVDTATGALSTATATRQAMMDHVVRIGPKEILLLSSTANDGDAMLTRVPVITDSPLFSRTSSSSPSPPSSSSSSSSSSLLSPPAPPAAQLADYGLENVRDVYVSAVPPRWAVAGKTALDLVDAHCSPTERDLIAALDSATQRAVSMAVAYLALVMQQDVPRLRCAGEYAVREHLEMDAVTRHSLELLQSAGMQRQRTRGTLFWLLNETMTKAGRRMLRERIAMPLTSIEAINKRQALVAALVQNNMLLSQVRFELKTFADLQQHLQKLARELAAESPSAAALHGTLVPIADCLRTALSIAESIAEQLAAAEGTAGMDQEGRAELQAVVNVLSTEAVQRVSELLQRSLNFEKPRDVSAKDAEVDSKPQQLIADGVSDVVDAARREWRQPWTQAHQLVAKSCSGADGQGEFTLVNDQDHGLMVEGNKSLEQFLDPAVFQRVPSRHIKSKYLMRFTSRELRQAGERVSALRAQHDAEQLAALRRFAQSVEGQMSAIVELADVVSSFDVAAALAEVAKAHKFCRPTLVREPVFEVEHGAHPVVEAMQSGSQFVRNSCRLDARDRLWIITGPNMGGKSTFLRQNALIVILAQMGSFVPAARAVIGVVDRIFTRIGASDNLTDNKSTFMVEMEETARIVRDATPRSFVVLDEIGRGTSVADGLAVAAAVCHHLASTVGCRTLFATHLHQLSSIASAVPRVSSHHVAVPTVGDGDLVFSHHIQPGSVDQSHGLVVAELAGLRGSVLAHAATIKAELDRVLSTVNAQVAAAVCVGEEKAQRSSMYTPCSS